MARLVRGSVLVEREGLYVEAARASGSEPAGADPSRPPSSIEPVLVTATLAVGTAI